MKWNSLILLVLVIFSFSVSAQELTKYGHYNGLYFSQSDFHTGTQIWTGTQDANSSVYFGNDDGVFSFNGKTWKIIQIDSLKTNQKNRKLINKTRVGKLFSNNKTTYVGRKDNFGILTHSAKGESVYQPLYVAKMTDEIGDIWNIFEHKESVYFIGERKIFELKGDKITELNHIKKADFTCKTSGICKEGILFAFKNEIDSKQRFYQFYSFKTKTFSEVKFPKDVLGEIPLSIINILKINGEQYLFNNDGRIFKLNIVNNKPELTYQANNYGFELLISNTVNSAREMDGKIYVGTRNFGLMVFNLDGSLFRVFDARDRMENAYVNDCFRDKEFNLWLCLDDGIHFFETSSILTYFDKNDGIKDVISKFDRKDNQLYIGTASDIWKSKLDNNQLIFERMNVLDQQFFDLKTFQTSKGARTLAIGYSGIYEINYAALSSHLISSEYAYVLHQNPLNPDEIFVGLDGTGLGKIVLKNNAWVFEKVVDEDGAVISICSAKNKLFFGVENRGVVVYDLITKKHYLIPGPAKNVKTHYVVSDFKGFVFAGFETGLHILTDDFKGMKPFNKIKGKLSGGKNMSIHRLFNYADKKLWVSIPGSEDGKRLVEQGWLSYEKGKWEWTSWPLAPISYSKSPLAYDIIDYKKGEFWITAGNQIFVFNETAMKKLAKKFTVSITEIFANDKLLQYNPNFAESLGDLSYQDNSLKFVFTPNSFIAIDKMQYRFILENYSDKWSEWSRLNFAEFNKIPEGSYTLKIQAKNIYGVESEILSYSFVVLPPWYRTWWAYTLYLIALIFLIYGVSRLSIQRVKNQNIRLEHIVQERTSEIAQQNEVLEHQKQEIEQKTQDIVDSIVYAKRIQETILPSKERLDEYFNEHFVFYRPKDIVSGDFYWAKAKGDTVLFSAIDCTGHGVPGALVSIVGNASLLRCVNEHKMVEPGDIMNMHREIVVKSFDSTGHDDVKDGMDMSMCALDKKTLMLKYAGANNECVIVRNKEIIELKPDKQPVGKYSYAFPFSQQEFQLQPKDCVYQFTDGFVDQFGGDKGKKLKSKPFKEMLVEISHLSMNEQYIAIQQFFDSWKDGYEQIDDVCVFGIKV